MAIDITHAEDLRKVFDQAASPINSPSEVVQAHKTINSRYARELLGALVQGKMLTVVTVNDEDTWVQTKNANIDKWLGIEPASTTKPKGTRTVSKKKEASPCLCGCGEMAQSNYRPGHDARHAGQIGREIAANHNTKGFDRRTLLAALPSDLLKAKAEKVAETVTAKTSKPKAEKPEPVADVEGTVKVGKTEFVAKRGPAGTVLYLDLKGNWQPASKTAAKTFQAG